MEHKVAASIDLPEGLANRRAFLETAVRALKQRTRTPQPVSALLFDLDRFKSINDRYGHAVGDRVLRAFADVAAVESRSTGSARSPGRRGIRSGALWRGSKQRRSHGRADPRLELFVDAAWERRSTRRQCNCIGVASVSASEPTEIESLADARGRSALRGEGARTKPDRDCRPPRGRAMFAAASIGRGHYRSELKALPVQAWPPRRRMRWSPCRPAGSQGHF